jgi:hypothetical protein
MLYRARRLVERLLTRDLPLVLKMDIRGSTEYLNLRRVCVRHGSGRLFDIGRCSPRECTYLGPRDFRSNSVDRREIILRSRWESGFDGVDPKGFEFLRYPHLLLDRHGVAGRLLAIAEAGVEDRKQRFSIGTPFTSSNRLYYSITSSAARGRMGPTSAGT